MFKYYWFKEGRKTIKGMKDLLCLFPLPQVELSFPCLMPHSNQIMSCMKTDLSADINLKEMLYTV